MFFHPVLPDTGWVGILVISISPKNRCNIYQCREILMEMEVYILILIGV